MDDVNQRTTCIHGSQRVDTRSHAVSSHLHAHAAYISCVISCDAMSHLSDRTTSCVYLPSVLILDWMVEASRSDVA